MTRAIQRAAAKAEGADALDDPMLSAAIPAETIGRPKVPSGVRNLGVRGGRQ